MFVTRFPNLTIALRHFQVLKVQNGIKTCCSHNHFNIYRNNKGISQLRSNSTYEVKSVQKDSILKKILNKIPFLNINRMRIKAAGYLLYESIADQVNYVKYFEEFNLPDTFYSWFVITELHIWMICVRAMAEGQDGRYLRNSIVEALWVDVAQRVRKLVVGDPGGTRQQVVLLSEQLQAALIAYDEGLQSDDIVFAGALWRRLYQMNDVDLQNLEQLVKYIRKQISILDNIPSEQLFKDKQIQWEPLGK